MCNCRKKNKVIVQPTDINPPMPAPTPTPEPNPVGANN
jgi:hypothetical protein